MALGNRKQNDIDAIPQEVQEYYQSERRERSGVAWLLALGTLVITLLLAVGLFFGGRWLWQRIFDGEPETVVTTQTTQPSQTSNDSSAASTDDNDTGTDSGTSATDGASSASDDTTAQSDGTSDDQVATDTAAPDQGAGTVLTSGGASDEAATTQTGKADELVSTGPADVAAIFAIAVVAGAVAYQLVWLRIPINKE